MTLKVALASFAHTHAASYARLLGALPDVEVLSADPDGAAAPDAGPRGADLAAQFGSARTSTRTTSCSPGGRMPSS